MGYTPKMVITFAVGQTVVSYQEPLISKKNPRKHGRVLGRGCSVRNRFQWARNCVRSKLNPHQDKANISRGLLMKMVAITGGCVL